MLVATWVGRWVEHWAVETVDLWAAVSVASSVDPWAAVSVVLWVVSKAAELAVQLVSCLVDRWDWSAREWVGPRVC